MAIFRIVLLVGHAVTVAAVALSQKGDDAHGAVDHVIHANGDVHRIDSSSRTVVRNQRTKTMVVEVSKNGIVATPEPTSEATPEPTPEPTTEPTPEPTKEPAAPTKKVTSAPAETKEESVATPAPDADLQTVPAALLPEKPAVVLRLKFAALNYYLLIADEVMQASLASVVVNAFIDSIGNGLTAANCAVTFLPGSVIAQVAISPPLGTSLQELNQEVTGSLDSVNSIVSEAVPNIPDISSIASGDIVVTVVTSPFVHEVGVSSRPEYKQESGSKRKQILISAAFVVFMNMVVSLCMSHP